MHSYVCCRYNYPDQRSIPADDGKKMGIPGTTTLIAEASLTGANASAASCCSSSVHRLFKSLKVLPDAGMDRFRVASGMRTGLPKFDRCWWH